MFNLIIKVLPFLAKKSVWYIIIAVSSAVGAYWWSLTSTITDLEDKLTRATERNAVCEEALNIEAATVEDLLTTIEQQNKAVAEIKTKLDEANKRADKKVSDIINDSNKPLPPSGTPQEINQWLHDTFQ